MRVSALINLLRGASGVLLVLLVLVARASPTFAQSIVLRRPALHWVRSEEAMSCIDPRTLAVHVEALIGPVLVRPSEAEHTIEGQVEVFEPGRLRVRVRVLDVLGHKVGERQFEQTAADCTVLTPAIVFVIGMAIDPEVAAHGLPPALVALLGQNEPPEQALLAELEQRPAQPAVLAAVQPRRREPVKPKPLPEVERETRPFQTSAQLRTSYGEAPRLTESLDLRLLYAFHPPFAVAGYVRGGLQDGPHRFLDVRKLHVALFDAGLLTCVGQHSSRPIRLHGCVGAELSVATGWSSGAPDSDDRDSLIALGVVAQLTTRIRIRGAWGVAVSLNGRFSTPRRNFVLESSGSAPQRIGGLPYLSGGVGLGPTFEF